MSRCSAFVSWDTPKIEQLWNTYGKSPKKLSREVSLLRQMNGFGHAEKFYENVEMNFSWEKDFKPCEGKSIPYTHQTHHGA
jgi:hypothetical protein